MNAAWLDHAACKGTPLDLWFPSVGSGRGHHLLRRAVVAEAAAICARCPVVEQCREYAAGQKWGVWTGEDREAS